MALEEYFKPDPRIENMDEFDEAESLLTTFCNQVTEEEYENQTAMETEKALKDLCDYLQKQPGEYFKILQKKKLEEMENNGIFSFLKTKMMRILHGEQYPACLMSPDESAERLNQLRNDIQKAFTYSQESKGHRFSRRIAARSAETGVCETRKNTTPVSSSNLPARRKRLSVFENDAVGTPSVSSSTQCMRRLRSQAFTEGENKPRMQTEALVATVMPSKKTDNHSLPDTSPSSSVSLLPSLLTPPSPPPPPPPPLPPCIPQQLEKKVYLRGHTTVNRNASNTAKNPSLNDKLQDKGLVPLNEASFDQMSLSACHQLGSSTETTIHEKLKIQSHDKGDENHVLSLEVNSDSSSDAEFVTPEMDIPVKSKKQVQRKSNISTRSHGVASNIHSELISSNPLTRLRSTQMPRSPGGTPLRPEREHTPQEPLHKALITVLRQKFKNVRTPSPLATDNSAYSPSVMANDSLNNTFTP